MPLSRPVKVMMTCCTCRTASFHGLLLVPLVDACAGRCNMYDYGSLAWSHHHAGTSKLWPMSGVCTCRAPPNRQSFFTGAAVMGGGSGQFSAAIEMMDSMRVQRRFDFAFSLSIIWTTFLVIPHPTAIVLVRTCVSHSVFRLPMIGLFLCLASMFWSKVLSSALIQCMTDDGPMYPMLLRHVGVLVILSIMCNATARWRGWPTYSNHLRTTNDCM